MQIEIVRQTLEEIRLLSDRSLSLLYGNRNMRGDTIITMETNLA